MTSVAPPAADVRGLPAPEALYVLPGEMRLALAPARLTTVLGSCVSVCLFDRRLRIGGMNHFLLPGRPDRPWDEPLRWGETATDALVLDLLGAGAAVATLEAKVFGGAHIAPGGVTGRRIGDRNAEAACAVLEARRIPVTARALGGPFGRKLVFDAWTGHAFVRELRHVGP